MVPISLSYTTPGFTWASTCLQRTYDLAIYGATGFTGRLVAAHVADKLKAGQKLTVALVGRNPTKLAELKTALTLHNSSAAVLTVVHADSTDQNTGEGRGRTLNASTPQPYLLRGSWRS
jgi:short-subunit dehydrogenase